VIISGGSRCAWRYWARHLTRTDENERVHVAEIKGLMVETVPDALREMRLMALGSRATNFLYHADINPREDEHLTDRQWDQAVDTLERNLGLEDHPRVVVEHEKLGRVHRHVMWLRVDPATMTVVSDSHDWSKHQATSRELERAFQLEPVTGVIGHDGKRRPRRPKNHETKRGLETGIKPEHVAAELTALWKQADTGQAFAAAITDRGYILARGDRGYAVIDQAGTTHSLARRIDGARKADITARMADVDLAALPSVEEARTQARARAAQLRAQGVDPEAPERQEAEAPAEAALSPGDQLAPAERAPAAEPPEPEPAPAAGEAVAEPQEPAPEPVADKAPPSAPAPLAAEELPPVDRFAQLVREAVRERDAALPERQEAAPLPASPEPFAEPAPLAGVADMPPGSWFAPDKTPPLLPDQLPPAGPDAFDHLTSAVKRAMGIGAQDTARSPAGAAPFFVQRNLIVELKQRAAALFSAEGT
jgi:Relaxase/Mobilisation nuclease domain